MKRIKDENELKKISEKLNKKIKQGRELSISYNPQNEIVEIYDVSDDVCQKLLNKFKLNEDLLKKLLNNVFFEYYDEILDIFKRIFNYNYQDCYHIFDTDGRFDFISDCNCDNHPKFNILDVGFYDEYHKCEVYKILLLKNLKIKIEN